MHHRHPAQPDPDGGPGDAFTSDDPASREAKRRMCIERETNIKSVGTLFFVGAIASALFALVGLASILLDGWLIGILVLVAGLGIGAIYGVIGHLLRRLDPRGRTGATIMMAFALASGTGIRRIIQEGDPIAIGRALASLLVPALVLYVLWSAPASTVFSAYYRTVIVPMTPHVRYRNVLPIVLFILLLTGLAAGAVLALAA